ncbi:MAG: hypothetical protein HGA31_01775 [Candidatus Moranbacteria bacterium]|nr:hypothetical protein [Candidatus Moranbacteria bacterium]
MFHVIRLAIWIAGILTLTVFGLRYFGYEPNWAYFSQQKAQCDRMLSDCRRTVILKGVQGVEKDCKWNCIDPGILIRKQAKK